MLSSRKDEGYGWKKGEYIYIYSMNMLPSQVMSSPPRSSSPRSPISLDLIPSAAGIYSGSHLALFPWSLLYVSSREVLVPGRLQELRVWASAAAVNGLQVSKCSTRPITISIM